MPAGPGSQNVLATGYQVPGTVAGPTETNKAKSRQYIKDGYKAMNRGDLQQARELAEMARSLKADVANF